MSGSMSGGLLGERLFLFLFLSADTSFVSQHVAWSENRCIGLHIRAWCLVIRLNAPIRPSQKKKTAGRLLSWLTYTQFLVPRRYGPWWQTGRKASHGHTVIYFTLPDTVILIRRQFIPLSHHIFSCFSLASHSYFLINFLHFCHTLSRMNVLCTIEFESYLCPSQKTAFDQTAVCFLRSVSGMLLWTAISETQPQKLCIFPCRIWITTLNIYWLLAEVGKEGEK